MFKLLVEFNNFSAMANRCMILPIYTGGPGFALFMLEI